MVDWSNWIGGIRTTVTLSSIVTKGGPVANWERKIREVRSATTSLNAVETSSTLATQDYAFLRRDRLNNSGQWIERELTGSFGATSTQPLDPATFIIAHVKNQAINDINQQIRDAQTALQGLVSAGEMGETVRMVNGAGRALFGRTKDYLQGLSGLGRRLTPQQLSRAIAEKWLGYNFGVKPLISDIDSGLKGLINLRLGRPPVVHLRASSKSSELNLITTDNSTYDQTFDVIRTVERRSRYECRIYGVYALESLTPHPISHEFGWTPSEFAPTLWELIPYSFLADYFANIGSIIDAHSINKSGVRWLNLGELRESRVTSTPIVSFKTASGWSNTSYRFSASPFQRYRRVKTRSIMSTGDLIPRLEFRIPGSSTRWCNILALARLHAGVSRDLRKRYR